MLTIWKFPLSVDDVQTVAMPQGARILTVQVQQGQPCLWAAVDSEQPVKPRTIRMYGTGHPIDPEDCYHWPLDGPGPRVPLPGGFIGTFQLNGGLLVFHVFEKLD